ncbi:MAG: ubiquinol-cytochrome c reductase iron-sulfur subunit [Gammaproteobacteria bacterium]
MENPAEANEEKVSGTGRRRALLGVSSVLGGAGAAAAMAPFAASLRPSRKTRAAGAPIAVSLRNINEGDLRIAVWRQKPVWVLRRSRKMLDDIEKFSAEELLDPDSESSAQPEYCKNKTRSIKPEYFVAVGLCTHLGCSPGRESGRGFLCACHGSRFDFAGRVVKGSPAPQNLFVPPHYYGEDDSIVIGADSAAA